MTRRFWTAARLAHGLRVGHLVYAAGTTSWPATSSRQAGTEIICHALDLSGPPARLLMGVNHLASVVAARHFSVSTRAQTVSDTMLLGSLTPSAWSDSNERHGHDLGADR
jgi:hypothetical protein